MPARPGPDADLAAPLRCPSGAPRSRSHVPRCAAPEAVAQAVRKGRAARRPRVCRGHTVLSSRWRRTRAILSPTTDRLRARHGRVFVSSPRLSPLIVRRLSGLRSAFGRGLRGAAWLMQQTGSLRAAHESGAERHAFAESGWYGVLRGAPGRQLLVDTGRSAAASSEGLITSSDAACSRPVGR